MAENESLPKQHNGALLTAIQMSQLKPSQYEPLLKEPLECWRCSKEFKNIPLLKTHLQEEWDAEAKREEAKQERKRKRDAEEQDGDVASGADEPTHKRQAKSRSESSETPT